MLDSVLQNVLSMHEIFSGQDILEDTFLLMYVGKLCCCFHCFS